MKLTLSADDVVGIVGPELRRRNISFRRELYGNVTSYIIINDDDMEVGTFVINPSRAYEEIFDSCPEEDRESLDKVFRVLKSAVWREQKRREWIKEKVTEIHTRTADIGQAETTNTRQGEPTGEDVKVKDGEQVADNTGGSWRQAELQREQYEVELLYHIYRVAGGHTLTGVFLPTAERYHSIVRDKTVIIEWVSHDPPVQRQHAPWVNEMARILSRLYHEDLVATKAPPTVYLENPPASEEDGAWLFITQKGIDLIKYELEHGDLGLCLSENGLIVDWNKAKANITQQSIPTARNTAVSTSNDSALTPEERKYRSELLKILKQYFSSEEDLKTLYFELGWTYSKFESGGTDTQARALVERCFKEARQNELVDLIARYRPSIKLPKSPE